MKGKEKAASHKKAKAIDWGEVNRRIGANRAGLERGMQPTAGERGEILKKRAKMLAVEPAKKTEAEEYIEVVEFLLANERYAVESRHVREIYPLKELTPVPCTPPFVLGIINVRGRILSVIDIKKFFDLPERGLTPLNKVVILSSGDMEFGILADAVIGAHNISMDNLDASLPTLTGVREEYLKGVTREQVVILDAGKLLSDRSIIVHENV